MSAPSVAEHTSQAPLWHAMPVDEVLRRLQSNPSTGLDDQEASGRLATYGPNRLPEGMKQGPFKRFLLQFNNVLIYVLLAAGFVKLMVGLWLDAAIIFGVVLVNTLLGFVQEGKAEKALDSIRNMLSAEARIVRSGETRFIPAEELVPGDVVLLESGDKIPADLRLVDVKNLRAEEAALTGESVPVDKTTDPVAEKATVGDRGGMAFSGTLIARRARDGSGRGHGKRDRARPHQSNDGSGEPAGDAPPASDQTVRLRHHGGHRGGVRRGVRLRAVGAGHGVHRSLPVGGQHRGLGNSGRVAGDPHRHAGHRRAAHGEP